MNKTLRTFIITGIVLVLGTVAIILFFPRESRSGTFDAFAQCLAEKKITMYGADWCPHCENEKKAFSDSFRFVPYVECPQDPNRCLAAGIKGYPTWIFPDGKKLEGEQGLQKLSAESGCPLRPSVSEASLLPMSK
jgi:glutaredoxin